MEIYKYVWQYLELDHLRDLLLDGKISKEDFKVLVEGVKNSSSESQYYQLFHEFGMHIIEDESTEPHRIIEIDKTTDIQLIDGVYYYPKEKMAIAIKGNVISCNIQEGIEEIIYSDDLRDILNDNTICDHGYLKYIRLPDSLKLIGDIVFQGTALQNIRLPEGVEELGKRAFALNDFLTDIVFPLKLRKIGTSCFEFCPKLEKVDLPQSVEIIQEYAFWGCTSIKSINLPYHIEKIESSCFKECTSLTHVIFPQKLKSIGKSAFEECISLKEIEFPHSLESIGISAFCRCKSIQSLVIPQYVKRLSDNAFSGCISLKTITFLGNLDKLNGGMFGNCHSLEEVILPKGLVEIGNSAFVHCISLKKIVIPDSVELIGWGAFSGCTLLEEFRFPSNLQVVLPQAFKGCKNLQVIYANNDIVKIFPNAFDDCNSLQAIVVPIGTLKRMQSIFPKRVAEKLVEIDQFRPETIVAVQHYKKDYVIRNVNRSFLNCFSWKYIHTNNVTLMHPNYIVGPCPKHLIYEREDLLSFETKYQDYYYKIQNDFIRGIFYNLDDEMYGTYAFILFFDLIASYSDNKNLSDLINQLEILCICCPKIGNYVPEKLMTIIDYKQLTGTSKLMILKAFPGFRGVMSIMDYALLVLNYSDSQIIKLKILEDVRICEIQLLKSYEKRYKVTQGEIIKETIDLVLQVVGKYDDFSKAALLAAKRQKNTSLTEIGSRFLRRCFQEVLRNHNPNIIYGDGIGYGDCGIEKIDEYLKEIMGSNTPIH